jgi:hypothetical protein
MTLPGETEAGSAGMQPCQGIAWWAHRDDDRARGASSRSSQRSIGSVDPYALKIPARKGGNHSLTENPASPFHAEPGHFNSFDTYMAPDWVSRATEMDAWTFSSTNAH